MAIQTRIINDLYTEIYVEGGNFITQAAPTNAHQFWKQKILTATESISDFREVTQAEKEALEAADTEAQEAIAKAETQSFDRQWEAIGGIVTVPGKVYEINGGTGTFADAVKAMTYFTEQPRADLSWLCFGKTLKLLPTIIVPNTAIVNLSHAFQSTYGLDKVVLKSTLQGGMIIAGDMFAAFNSSQVKELDCVLDISSATNLKSAFPYALIREIRLYGLKSDVSFPYANNLSLVSISYMIEHAANTKPITITLPPDAYARVTEEIFALAAEKNITIAST